MGSVVFSLLDSFSSIPHFRSDGEGLTLETPVGSRIFQAVVNLKTTRLTKANFLVSLAPQRRIQHHRGTTVSIETNPSLAN